MLLRSEYAASYRSLIKDTIVKALRRVFDEFYGDNSFRGLKITTAYPLVDQDYPSIVVIWHGRSIRNAGLANVEHIADSNGIMRAFLHSQFRGSIEFQVHALSPDDIDYLMDALLEVLRFGTLETQTNNFFDELYNQATIDGAQISLNTDEITELGDNAEPAPWGTDAGNTLVYSGGFEVEVFGSYYSADRSGEVSRVLEVDIYPYIMGSAVPDGRYVVGDRWSDRADYSDGGLILGRADIGGI